MKKRESTKSQLREEIAELRRRILELEKTPRGSREELDKRVEERTRELAEAALRVRQSQRLIEQIADTTPNLIYMYECGDFRVQYANRQLCEFAGYSAGEIRRMGEAFFDKCIHPEDLARFKRVNSRLATANEWGVAECELRMKHSGLGWRWIACRETVFDRAPDGGPRQILAAAQDITERKEAETRAKGADALLELFAKETSRPAYLQAALKVLAGLNGCQAVGIRLLSDDGRIPYAASLGFDEEFLKSECWLSVNRDQCACTRVVLQRPDPQDAPVMTRRGSFCCNNTFRFVGGLSIEQQARFRGVCLKSGFASVAVVPIRHRHTVLGAIHLADKREGMLPRQSMGFLESASLLLGEAIYRFNVEDELRRSNRALKTLSACSQTIPHTSNEAELLRQVCQCLIDPGGYRLAWVGYAEQDEAKTVRPVAQAGFEAGYLETLRITWADTERGRGPTGTAIRTGQPSMCRNIPTDPDFAPWRQEAMKRGYAASIALPLMAAGRTIGALMVYAPEPDAFDSAEVRLLADLADDLAYGVAALRARAERDRAQEELQQSERRYRELLNLSPEAINLIVDGKIAYANAAGLKLFAATRLEDIVGKAMLDFIVPSRRDITRERMERILHGGAAPLVDTKLVRLDGRVVDVEAIGTRISYEGKPAILGIIRDITERKIAEEAVSSMASFLSENPNPVLRFDQTGVILYANEAAQGLLSSSGCKVGEQAPPSYRDLVAEALRSGSNRQVDIRCADRLFSFAIVPVTSSGYVNFYGRDVTERERARLALEASERRFRAIFNQTFQITGLLSPDGIVLEANQTALDFGGVSRADVIGRLLWETPWWAHSPESQKRLRAAVSEASQGRFVRYETELLGARGVSAIMDFSIIPVRDEAGKVVLLIHEGRDISEQRRLERQILEIGAQERARVGRNLHDVLGQQLTGIAFLSKVLANRLAGRSATDAQEAAKICALASEAIVQARALARGLCPVELRAEGLMSALQQLARSVETLYGIRCDFRCGASVPVEDHVLATHLYHIAHEAAHNAARHGKAKNIVVRLFGTKSRISLTVKDDGAGFPEDFESKAGIGLQIMRHRATEIGASLDIRNLSSGGAIVLCSAPHPGVQKQKQEMSHGESASEK